MFPYFNANNLSNDELFKKIVEIRQKRAYAVDHGLQQMVQELDVYISSLSLELDERTRCMAAEAEKNELQKNPELRGRYGLDPIEFGEIDEVEDDD